MIVEDRYIPSTEAVKFIAKAKNKYGDRYNYRRSSMVAVSVTNVNI